MKPLYWGSPHTLECVEKELRSGGVVLAGGDTLLGLLVELSDKGYSKLDSIKKREKKPYLLLVSSQKKALHLIEKDTAKICQIEKLMDVCWPGSVTLILKAKPTVPAGVKSTEGNVAIRVPDHVGLLDLLGRFDGLFSTSANSSGKLVPACLEDVEESIVEAVACVVLNEGQAGSSLPSAIIDCTGEKIKIVREGVFSIEELVDFLE